MSISSFLCGQDGDWNVYTLAMVHADGEGLVMWKLLCQRHKDSCRAFIGLIIVDRKTTALGWGKVGGRAAT